MNCRTKSSILPFVLILSDSTRIFFLCSIFGIRSIVILPNFLACAARLLDDPNHRHYFREPFDKRPRIQFVVALVRSGVSCIFKEAFAQLGLLYFNSRTSGKHWRCSADSYRCQRYEAWS